MNLLDREVAVFIFQEADAKTVELLDDRVATLGVFVDRLLVDDAVIGDGDFLGVLLRRGVAGNHRVVEPVHSHRNGAGPLHIGLFKQDDVGLWIPEFRLQRRHRPGGAAPNHENVARYL